jgi:hypothetical protein
MDIRGHLMSHHPICLGDAVLFVTGFPVSLLAVPAAVQHEATAGAGQKLGRAIASSMRQAIAANQIIRSMSLFALLRGRHCG